MKWLGVLLLSLNRMLVHRSSLPHNLLGFPKNSLVPTHTHGWGEELWELSVLPKNMTQCPRPGLKLRPLDLETRTLTMRSLLGLHNWVWGKPLSSCCSCLILSNGPLRWLEQDITSFHTNLISYFIHTAILSTKEDSSWLCPSHTCHVDVIRRDWKHWIGMKVHLSEVIMT